MKYLKILILCFFLVFSFVSELKAREWFKEYKVIAVYIYNLLDYVKWPNEKQRVICIMQDKNISSILEQLSQKYNFKVKKLDYPLKSYPCSILYIDREYSKYMETILKNARKNPVLTVSTSPKFIDNGGMVGIISVGDKTGLEINYKEAKKQGISISADLLELAKRVL